jgi:hypothetical protein
LLSAPQGGRSRAGTKRSAGKLAQLATLNLYRAHCLPAASYCSVPPNWRTGAGIGSAAWAAGARHEQSGR